MLESFLQTKYVMLAYTHSYLISERDMLRILILNAKRMFSTEMKSILTRKYL